MARVELHILEGPAAGRRVPVARSITFGRVGDTESLGPDPELSRTHARLALRDDGGLELEDLGSTNGTRLNGRPVRGPERVQAGDRIALGTTLLEVRAPAASTVTGARPGTPTEVPAPVPSLRAPEQPLPSPELPGARGAPPHPAVSGGPGAERRTVGLGVALVLAGLAAGVAAAVALWASNGGSSAGGQRPPFDGTLYLLSNRSQPNANSVLAYRYRAGMLAPLDVREYPTGGAGAFDQANSGVLDSVDQIALDRGRSELFAVNSSSDTIAAFHIASDGTLSAVRGSPFPSEGRGPASLAVRGQVLIVVNKAFDGVRKGLKTQPGSFASLPIRGDGSLGPAISTIPMPPASAGTQVLPTSDGSLVFGSLESGPFLVFRLAANGSLTQAPGSPRPLDPRRFPPTSRDGPFWPQGMALAPSRRLLYANVSNAAKLVVYSYDRDGRLALVGAVKNKGAKLPCWTAINPAGTRLYTDNAGNGTVSVFDIGADPRRPRQLQNLKLRTSGNPWNLTFDPSGRFLFVLNPRAIDFIEPGAGNTVHSLRINGDGTLSELDASPVDIPVSTDTQPQGLVAVTRR